MPREMKRRRRQRNFYRHCNIVATFQPRYDASPFSCATQLSLGAPWQQRVHLVQDLNAP